MWWTLLLALLVQYKHIIIIRGLYIITTTTREYLLNECHKHRYSVPFEEDERDPSVWFLDHNYLENMAAMFKKVNSE